MKMLRSWVNQHIIKIKLWQPYKHIALFYLVCWIIVDYWSLIILYSMKWAKYTKYRKLLATFCLFSDLLICHSNVGLIFIWGHLASNALIYAIHLDYFANIILIFVYPKKSILKHYKTGHFKLSKNINIIEILRKCS